MSEPTDDFVETEEQVYARLEVMKAGEPAALSPTPPG